MHSYRTRAASLTWEAAEKLGELSKAGIISVSGERDPMTGVTYLRIDVLKPSNRISFVPPGHVANALGARGRA